jgi:hypothetical protein
MASLNEIAYSIATKLGKPIDFMLINDLKFSIINYRALFIRQDYTKNGRYNALFIQDLGCVPTEKVDSAECCDVESECNVIRTVDELPDPVRLKGLEDFVFVGAIDKKTRYTMILPEEVSYVSYNKYSKLDPRYYYMNSRVYLVNVTAGYVNIRGIFADPREAARFNHCAGADCYTDDTYFPCPEDMIAGIKTGIIQGELQILRDTNEGKEIKADS